VVERELTMLEEMIEAFEPQSQINLTQTQPLRFTSIEDPLKEQNEKF